LRFLDRGSLFLKPNRVRGQTHPAWCVMTECVRHSSRQSCSHRPRDWERNNFARPRAGWRAHRDVWQLQHCSSRANHGVGGPLPITSHLSVPIRGRV